ncbi:MAG TPA: M42 family metallopeptidase [Ruminococcus sp.]|nr:M42 family metallopeptidase [Ruminococcus sp.]
MIKTLKELCLLNGISGDESCVREYIIEKIRDKCDYSVDNLGNITAFRKGKKTPEKKLMIAAHMDEVGLIVTSVRSDGTLTFETVGGIDSAVIIGKRVKIGKNGLSGVVGSKAIHKLSAEEREKAPKISDLYIDFGAADKAEAEKYVSAGECVYFDSEFMEFGNNRIKSKAIDDRAGCALMLRLIEEEPEYDTFFVFNVQEEIGLRGSTVSAFSLQPDIAIVLEATTAADIDGADGAAKVCTINGGPVVSFMDRSTMYDKELYKTAFETAKENGIKCQTKSMIAGGNDSGAIHISGKGVRTIAVSLPCRYLHSPSCVISKQDFDDAYRLVKLMMKRVLD